MKLIKKLLITFISLFFFGYVKIYSQEKQNEQSEEKIVTIVRRDTIKIGFFSWYRFKIGEPYSNVMRKIREITWLEPKENVQEEMFGKRALSIRFYPNDYIKDLSFQFEQKFTEFKQTNLFLSAIRVIYSKKNFSYNDIYQKLKKKYDDLPDIEKKITFDYIKWQNNKNIITFYRKDNLIFYQKKDLKVSEILKINSDRQKFLDFF